MAAGTGDVLDGPGVAALRGRVQSVMDEALEAVATHGGMTVEPRSELMVVDRRAWVTGNVRTIATMFDLPVSGPEARIVAWEGGAFLGLLARAVLAQYDPYRDQLLVVYPNLGDVAHGDALRWLVFHEVTHLGQFRTAPWMRDHIVQLGHEALRLEDRTWMKEAARRLVAGLPDLVEWGRNVLAGRSDGSTPLLDILPPEQRATVERLHALLTVLEGHATHLTDVISEQVIEDYEAMQRRIKEQRRRPPALKLLEAIAGIEMKRQQYVLGRAFCAGVWEHGGAAALAPVWAGPENIPTSEELRDPAAWLARVGG